GKAPQRTAKAAEESKKQSNVKFTVEGGMFFMTFEYKQACQCRSRYDCNLEKDQVRVFRKSAVDIARLIKRALDFDVSLYCSSELFICTAISYLRRLKRFEKITEMMQ
ncbi:unnamed protein product, partial [Porites evermanni]